MGNLAGGQVSRVGVLWFDRRVKPWVAISLVVGGGAALAFVSFGEGAFGVLGLVGVPVLLAALFVVPLLTAERPVDWRRIGLWGGAAAGLGWALLAVADLKMAALPLIFALLLLVFGWPFAVSGACVVAATAVRSSGRRRWGRPAWASALGLVGTYGYGLNHIDNGLTDIKDKTCRYAPSEGFTGEWTPGRQSLLPLSDTSCGADTVPWFVNPLLAVLAVLLVLSVASHARTRRKARAVAVVDR
jgi:hypothetical protein